MDVESRALELYQLTGRHFWIYSGIARYKHWWNDASAIERGTVLMTCLLVGLVAGLILAYKIRGG